MARPTRVGADGDAPSEAELGVHDSTVSRVPLAELERVQDLTPCKT